MKKCSICKKKLGNRNQSYLCRTHSRKVALKTHGMSGTPTYKTWTEMKYRCVQPKSKSFKDYGDRGIEVCNEWFEFENFLKDMGVRPKDKTLDRIDNDGNYCKENCRWATLSEQATNKRNITLYDGKTLRYWDDKLGFSHGVMRRRIKISGWSFEKARLTPKFKRGYKTAP